MSEQRAIWRQFYEANKDRAVVDFDIFRRRVARGMAWEEALTTRKVREWGGNRSKLYYAILTRPGITRGELLALVDSHGAMKRALDSLITAGLIAVVMRERLAMHGPASIQSYWPTEKAQPDLKTALRAARTHDTDDRDSWTPAAWVHPIRALALGLRRAG